MTKVNSIKKYMTKTPRTIGEDIPLSQAIKMMREYKVRHLPVQYAGKVIGILSDRDIKFALAFHPKAKELKVGDVMTEDPYAVDADCPLTLVVAEMAKKKLGCAIVENSEGRAIGIFTAVDALGLFGEWLRKKAVAEPSMRLIS